MVDRRITLRNPCIISEEMEDKGIMRRDWPRIIEKIKEHLKQTLLVLNNLLVWTPFKSKLNRDTLRFSVDSGYHKVRHA